MSGHAPTNVQIPRVQAVQYSSSMESDLKGSKGVTRDSMLFAIYSSLIRTTLTLALLIDSAAVIHVCPP